mgnify:CR=1 FL=1
MEAGPWRRGCRPREPQEQEGEQKSVVNQNQEQEAKICDPVATALNRMTDILELLAPQQDQGVSL